MDAVVEEVVQEAVQIGKDFKHALGGDNAPPATQAMEAMAVKATDVAFMLGLFAVGHLAFQGSHELEKFVRGRVDGAVHFTRVTDNQINCAKIAVGAGALYGVLNSQERGRW